MAKKTQRRKTVTPWRVGNPPEQGHLIDSLGQWQLWITNPMAYSWWREGKTEWLSVKLIATQPQLRKANFFLNIFLDHFHEQPEWAKLNESFPELLPWLESQCEKLVAQRGEFLSEEWQSPEQKAQSLIAIVSQQQPVEYTALYDEAMRTLKTSQKMISLILADLVEQGVVIRERIGHVTQFRVSEQAT